MASKSIINYNMQNHLSEICRYYFSENCWSNTCFLQKEYEEKSLS